MIIELKTIFLPEKAMRKREAWKCDRVSIVS